MPGWRRCRAMWCGRCAGAGCGPGWSSPVCRAARCARGSAAHGVLAKETHGNTIRLAPPLVISEEDLDWGLDRIEAVITG